MRFSPGFVPSRAVLIGSVALVLTVVAVPSAGADDGPRPKAVSVFQGKIDVTDPDLKMVDGATLAQGKVLEIKQVVGDEAGNEQREDSNSEVKFSLQAEVLFGKDSAELSSAANSRIRAIADEIRKQNAKKVRVFGFTDDLGSSAHGDVLSKQRADAVHGELSKELAAVGITYEIRGYGEQFPIAENSSEENRRKNRRVEVSFPRGAAS
ncbi:OmpA family protein [Streptomyces lunaelactis]|uniref:OmpA family protein n=1 Tax=Streptomyces lunaelactis TaxID=1535768 RepID=UPI001585800E|nr:OmpA family protein [Streptomyces lunaelactis]NUK05982.1 OmpA family protein [Streptomyces lunaelactis]NUK12396.1 OmpA family protein [Streptomyces lunaelactis]NUK17729.1 OmpA family protein [Streptomyces lunaelactis]NUK38505.1 OmpA family protein [Streptomyces lunaelactis]NUK45790.1 OmpA family protein [Streptomyces lunaelactis]